MLTWIRRNASYANVLSTIAVFGVLAGGGAYAASKIGATDIKKNAVRSKHIKNEQVKSADLKPPEVINVKANPETGSDPCEQGKTRVLCGKGMGFSPWFHSETYRKVGYYKAAGQVHLTGFAASGFQTPETVFILPKPYRPDDLLGFAAGCDYGSQNEFGSCLITVGENGEIKWADGNFYTTGGIALDGISFATG